MPHGDYSILVVIKLFSSVSSRLYKKDNLLLIQICNSQRGLYLVNELAPWWKSWKVVLVWSSLKTYDDIFFECFIASASSEPFQTLFSRPISCQLATFYLFIWKTGIKSQEPDPFRFHGSADHILNTWNRKGLACETNPTVFNRCSPLQTSMNWWYKGH